MPKFELTKSIEATKLNPRTEIPTSDPPVTIPFGAIIDNVTRDRDDRKFSYLGQRYRCTDEMFQVATVPVGGAAAESEPEAAATGQPAPEAAAEPAPAQPAIVWERMTANWRDLMRLEVPGGWLVALRDSSASPSFYPDPDHRWR